MRRQVKARSSFTRFGEVHERRHSVALSFITWTALGCASAWAQVTTDTPPFNPNNACVDGAFTDFANTTGATSTGSTFASVSLSAGQASTSQVLQNLADRRDRDAKVCPAGFTNQNGACTPTAPVAVAAAAPPSTAASSTAGQNASKKPGVKKSTPAAVEPDPATTDYRPDELEAPQYGTWAEVFYEKEERSNLPDGSGGTFDRDQNTMGMQSGIDFTRTLGGGAYIRFGGLFGFSVVKQDFGTQTLVDADNTTDFTHRFQFNNISATPDGDITGNFPGLRIVSNVGGSITAERTLTLPNPLTISVQSEQKIDGPSFGLYGTYQRGNYFIDFLGKVDVFDLVRRSSTSTTGFTRLNTSAFAVSQRNGCISRDYGGDRLNAAGQQYSDFADPTIRDGQSSQNPDVNNLLTGFQTATRNSIDRADASNYTLATNIGFRTDLAPGWWYEPLAGVRYTFATFDNVSPGLGLENGHALRLQAGVTVGHSRLVNFGPGPLLWTTSIAGLLYSDVIIDGFVRDGGGFSPLSVEADEGELRVQGIVRNEFDLLDGSLAYSEFSVRGGEDLWAIGGKLGIRFEF